MIKGDPITAMPVEDEPTQATTIEHTLLNLADSRDRLSAKVNWKNPEGSDRIQQTPQRGRLYRRGGHEHRVRPSAAGRRRQRAPDVRPVCGFGRRYPRSGDPDQQSSSVEELIERLTRSKEDLDISYKILKAKKNDLVRSEKLAFAGRIAAGIAHEIRNPLTNVIAGRIKDTIGANETGLLFLGLEHAANKY